MTRRHETLIPLTHDHHHALAQARRLQETAGLTDENERRNETNDFINFYFGRAVRHFHEEEELFFAPVVDEPEAKDLVLRAVSDHLRLHALVRTVKRQLTDGQSDPELLKQISDLLTEHVRFEEQQLFPLIEKLVPEEQLQDLAIAGRRDV
jgi:hemerythrin-like domain-containing protein